VGETTLSTLPVAVGGGDTLIGDHGGHTPVPHILYHSQSEQT